MVGLGETLSSLSVILSYPLYRQYLRIRELIRC